MTRGQPCRSRARLVTGLLTTGLLTVGLLWAEAVAGTSMWRCGPDGRVFSDRPCSDGRLVPLAPAPSPQRQQEAVVVAQRQALLAEQLRQERLARQIAPAAWPEHRPEHRQRATKPVHAERSVRQDRQQRPERRRADAAPRHDAARGPLNPAAEPSAAQRRARVPGPSGPAAPTGAGT